MCWCAGKETTHSLIWFWVKETDKGASHWAYMARDLDFRCLTLNLKRHTWCLQPDCMTSTQTSCHTEMANPSSCTFPIPKTSRNRCTRDTPVGSYIHPDSDEADAVKAVSGKDVRHTATRHASFINGCGTSPPRCFHSDSYPWRPLLNVTRCSAAVIKV